MEIFGIGLPEIMLIMAVALIVFGPERLPEIAREAGKWVRQFRQMTSDATSEIRTLTDELNIKQSLDEFKNATNIVSEEVTSFKNEVTGVVQEQYKVTYETLTDTNTSTEAVVSATAHEISDDERDEFNRRKMEEFATAEASSVSNQNLIDSAVESSPATIIDETSAGQWQAPETSPYDVVPQPPRVDRAAEFAAITSPENQFAAAYPIKVGEPAQAANHEELNATVELTSGNSFEGAADAGPASEEVSARPKPRIARRSAFGGARQKEREQEQEG